MEMSKRYGVKPIKMPCIEKPCLPNEIPQISGISPWILVDFGLQNERSFLFKMGGIARLNLRDLEIKTGFLHLEKLYSNL